MNPSVSQESFMDGLEDASFVFDEGGTPIEWKRAVNDVTGYADEELRGLGPRDFFDAEDAERVEAAITEVLESGQFTVEADLITSEGERIPYEFKASNRANPRTNSAAFAGIGHDISARRESETQRQALLDRMGDAFLGLDEEWHITYANEEAHRILAGGMGLNAETDDLVGLHLWEEIPEAVDTVFYEKYHLALES